MPSNSISLENTSKTLRWIAWSVCILAGIVISIKSLREPDIWWMLITGEWIVDHKAVLKQDIFSFTFAGKEWINVKWGFEVLLVFFRKIGGPEFTMMIQAFFTTFIIIYILKIYQKTRRILFEEKGILPD